tara:strand:- start:380 stop:1483 length:1104 start_codon:yes stop_codon:yes gene_type:complete
MKVLGINFIFLVTFLFSPALLLHFYRTLRQPFALLNNQTSDLRAYYPTYANKKVSIELFNEFKTISTKYRSFIGWKREKVNLKHINIAGPYNSRKSSGELIDNSAWFFGGSTMWATGASDSQTIPSHFNSLTNIPVYNFGEAGWNSRQSLNQLINAIGDNHDPSIVVFYDGVNDVYTQCRSEVNLLPAHSREQFIQNALTPMSIKKISRIILEPYIVFTNRFNIELPKVNSFKPKKYNCDTNPAKARLIASHLINNWYTAYALSKSKDFDFYSILQPTLFTSKTNSEYFPLYELRNNSELEIQYRTVYPLILKEIEKRCESDKDFCFSMIDGTNWLDGTNNIFIDFCHLNSLGNKVIAQRLKSLLKK